MGSGTRCAAIWVASNAISRTCMLLTRYVSDRISLPIASTIRHGSPNPTAGCRVQRLIGLRRLGAREHAQVVGLERVEFLGRDDLREWMVAARSIMARIWNALRMSLRSTGAICSPRLGPVNNRPAASRRGMGSRRNPAACRTARAVRAGRCRRARARREASRSSRRNTSCASRSAGQHALLGTVSGHAAQSPYAIRRTATIPGSSHADAAFQRTCGRGRCLRLGCWRGTTRRRLRSPHRLLPSAPCSPALASHTCKCAAAMKSMLSSMVLSPSAAPPH